MRPLTDSNRVCISESTIEDKHCSTIEPLILAATAVHKALVKGIALWGCVSLMKRTVRSMEDPSTTLPESDLCVHGGEMIAIFGIVLGTSLLLFAMPIAIFSASLISSSHWSFWDSLLKSLGRIVPLIPTSSERTKVQGFAASIQLAYTLATLSTVILVGSKCPVFAPPGRKKSSWVFAPVPLTPSIEYSPTSST